MNLDEAYWTLTRQVVALGERIITIPKEIAALESERQTCIEERSRINSQIQAVSSAKAIVESLAVPHTPKETQEEPKGSPPGVWGRVASSGINTMESPA